jgi:hypothetical protein
VRGTCSGCDAPDRIADVISDEERTGLVDGHTHGSALRIAVLVDETA